jgi:hypothetical protein
MGLFEFLLIVILIVVLAALTVWVIGQIAPGTPALVLRIVWAVAVLVILFILAQATGILRYDPRIPHL